MRRNVTLIASLVLALGLTSGCSKQSQDTAMPVIDQPAPEPEPGPAEPELTQAEVMKTFDECWIAFDAKDKEKFKTCYADDATSRIVDAVPPMEATGPEAIAEMAFDFGTAFSNLQHTPKVVIIDGNQVAAIVHATGTNDKSLWGMPPTNKQISMLESHVAVLNEDGKVVRDDHYIDIGTMMAQLGISPSPMAPMVEEMRVPEDTVRVLSRDDETEKANLAVVKGLAEPMNQRDATGMMDAYADDAVFRFVADKRIVEGKAEMEKMLTEWMAMSKDMTTTTRNAFAGGDWVVAETSSSGTLDVDVPGLPVSTKGKKFDQKYLEFVRLEDGLIKEHWVFSNSVKWGADMGLIDPSKMPGGEAPSGKPVAQ